MLSRTAENLFWTARYIERAENIARLIDVGQRMANMSLDPKGGASEWHSAIVAAGCEQGFFAQHKEVTATAAVHHLARDLANPSSIARCLETARSNSRSVRTALTVDMWHAINTTWMELGRFKDEDFLPENLPHFLDWVKDRSLMFLGAATNTMMQNDAYWFTRLGTFIERIDNTARLLDVKFEVLLPEHSPAGSHLDYYQWSAILRSVSALRAYKWVYRERLKPWLVAELLILRPEMPRSLATSMGQIVRFLDLLAQDYGQRGECHRLAGELDARLRYGRIEQIFQTGLHEFLTRMIDDTMVLGQEIAREYLQ